MVEKTRSVTPAGVIEGQLRLMDSGACEPGWQCAKYECA